MAKIKIERNDEDEAVRGHLKGVKRVGNHRVRHMVTLQVETGESALKGNTVWVGASPQGPSEVGAYVNREDFLDLVSQVFDVYIEDNNSGDNWYGTGS